MIQRITQAQNQFFAMNFEDFEAETQK